MKQVIAVTVTILFLLTGACQPQANTLETATRTPVKVDAATFTPSSTPSPEPTITSTPIPLTYPLEAGTALPQNFTSLKISPENAASLEEVIRIKQKDIVIFDAKYWNGNWLVDTNQGVKLLNESGEWIADLVATQRICPNSKNMGSRTPSNIFIGPGGIGVVALDGVHIYSSDGQKQTSFVPLDEGYLALGWSCMDPLFLAVVSPDMKWVAVSKRGISYNTTEIFSTESRENVISLPGDAVRMFSPDSQYLLFESGVNRFFLYKTSDWSRSLLLRSDDYILTFGFSPSSEYLFYHRTSGWVIFRPSDSNATLVNKQAVSLMFNRNTNEIGMLYWGDEENIHVWDFDSAQEIRMEKIDTDGWEYPLMDLPSITGFERNGFTDRGTFNTTCDLHGDEFTCFSGPEACTFDLNGGQSCASVQSQKSIKKSIDGLWGERILYEKDGSYSGLLPPWEMSTEIYWTGSTWWMTLAEDNPPGFQWSMMSPDRSHFMYTTGEAGNQLNIILVFMTNDIEVGRIKLQRLLNAVISPDSKYMLAAVNTIGDQVWLLDLETGKVIKEFVDRTSSARGLAFSADSRLAAYVDVLPVEENGFFVTMGKVLVYDLVEGKELTSIDLDLKKGNVNRLTFSLDSSLIAAGTFDGKVSIYDVGTGEQVHSWYAHIGTISDLDFSSDGTWLLTAGGMDENIKLWMIAP